MSKKAAIVLFAIGLTGAILYEPVMFNGNSKWFTLGISIFFILCFLPTLFREKEKPRKTGKCKLHIDDPDFFCPECKNGIKENQQSPKKSRAVRYHRSPRRLP